MIICGIVIGLLLAINCILYLGVVKYIAQVESEMSERIIKHEMSEKWKADRKERY